MKKIAIVFAIVLAGCSTSISTKIVNKNYQRLEPNIQILVLENDESLPENSEFIGDIKVGDAGFTKDCGYNTVLSDARIAARNMGANLIQIVQIKEPTTLGSSCYRIKAKAYRNMNPEALSKITETREAKNKSRLPEGSDYALIHFYRPRVGSGALLHYSIKNENDSVVGKLGYGDKFILKTKDFGYKSFYGVLETKEDVKINIEKGKEYFVRCSVTMGVVLGRPQIDLVENHIGMKEFNGM